jgi:integrase
MSARRPWTEEKRKSGRTQFRIRRGGVNVQKTFASLTDGRRWAAETIAEIDRGVWIDPRDGKITLDEWSPRWVATKRSKSGKYQRGIESMLRLWVLPRFGNVALRDITQEAVIAWVGDLAIGTARDGAKPLSPSRVAQARLVISGCLELAVAESVIPRNTANTKLVRMALPRIPQKVVKAEDLPTELELAKMIHALPDRWSVFAEVLAFGALRLGEGLALRPMNVTPRGLTLTHAVGLNPTGPGLILKPLKGYAERKVPLAAETIERVYDEIAERGLDFDDLIFPGDEGGLMHDSTWHNSIWVPTREELELPPFTTRHLRNYGARLFLEAGATIEDLRKLLGHQDIKTTARYLTTDDDRLAGLADRVAATRRESLRRYSVAGDAMS